MDRPEAMEEKRRWQDLPDDLLVDILRHVAALRDLAVSRCVCKAWRAATDDARLLRPCSLAGLFINYIEDINFSELISRPSSSPAVKYPRYMTVEDHCNGLLLCYRSVLNPATGRRAPVPEPPPPAHAGMEDFPQDAFLVCDPTVSPHYEVFAIPRVETEDEDVELVLGVDADGFRTCTYVLQAKRRDMALLASEWPPSPLILNVFSSVTGRWEKRLFHRDGEAAGTVQDMRLEYPSWLCRRHAVYYRAALYVHCEHYFLVRLSLPDNKYQVIKPPGRGLCESPKFHLGRSEKGIYYALLDEQSRLRVWILDESRRKAEWELNHDSVCSLLKPSLNCIQKDYGPWMLQDINCNRHKEVEALVEHKSEWNSDDESIPHCQDSGQNRPDEGYLVILAFHPYKEIVFFLRKTLSRLIAYHLNTSKLEDLGSLSPDNTEIDDIGMSFPYTPCTIRDFPER